MHRAWAYIHTYVRNAMQCNNRNGCNIKKERGREKRPNCGRPTSSSPSSYHVHMDGWGLDSVYTIHTSGHWWCDIDDIDGWNQVEEPIEVEPVCLGQFDEESIYRVGEREREKDMNCCDLMVWYGEVSFFRRRSFFRHIRHGMTMASIEWHQQQKQKQQHWEKEEINDTYTTWQTMLYYKIIIIIM